MNSICTLKDFYRDSRGILKVLERVCKGIPKDPKGILDESRRSGIGNRSSKACVEPNRKWTEQTEPNRPIASALALAARVHPKGCSIVKKVPWPSELDPKAGPNIVNELPWPSELDTKEGAPTWLMRCLAFRIGYQRGCPNIVNKVPWPSELDAKKGPQPWK